ncbi:MAG TPA: ABC transporter permease [Verrucomicrobiae bacterium]|jgi:putative ABC transport system permease protein|nr:ABC transporter permease [Verrucomicrobiae bacterium]
MMDLKETLSVSIDALRANKLRAMLTSLGVIIGSASIVLVVTVALTSKKFVISKIEAVGSNVVWVELVRSSEKAQPLSYELTLDDLDAVKNVIPEAVQAAGTSDIQMSVVAQGVVRPVTLIGVTMGYQEIRRLVVLRGRYLDALDMETRSKTCVITPQLAKRLFGQDNPVGRELHVGELIFTIIGVFNERVETFGLSDIQTETVLIPFGLIKYYTGLNTLKVLDVQAATPESVPRVQRQLSELLQSRHPSSAEYHVQTLTSILTAARDISLALTIVLIVIAFIALVISGIGIMNIMLVTVTERTREIGIRKAIGAARKEIMYQFLTEAFLISGGGAVLGILIGLLVPAVAQMFLPGNLRVPVSPLSVVLAFVVSCSTGLFFGYLPANQAAKLQPIESLRYE